MDFISEELLYQKSPQQLTAMLYEGCLEHLEEAIESINSRQLMEANERLKKANDILHRLGVGLQYEAGVIAEQLDQLYNYMADRLVEANIKKDAAMIREVKLMLQTVADAWNQALNKKDEMPVKRALYKKLSSYEQNIATVPVR